MSNLPHAVIIGAASGIGWATAQTLAADERSRWDDYRRRRLLEPGLGEQTLPDYFAQIRTLREEHHDNPASLALLDALDQWGQHLHPTP